MARQDSLFRLIKSLTKSEKSYVVKSISHFKDAHQSHYLKLFYAIDKLDEYDDDLVKNKFNGQRFAGHLPVIKNYLFNAILKHLKAYNYESSIKNKLVEMLQDADILIQKSMHKESYKVLEKAGALAIKYEFFLFALEVYDKMIRLNYDIPANEQSFNESLANYHRQIEILKAYTEITEHKRIQAERNLAHVCTDAKERRKKINKLLTEPLVRENFRFSSYKSGLYHYQTRGLITTDYYEDYEKNGYLINKKLVQHLESDAELLKVNLISYSAALNNLINCCLRLKKYTEFFDCIAKLKRIETNNIYLQFRIKEKIINNILVYYIFTKKFAEGKKYIEEIEKEITVNEAQFHQSFRMSMIDNCYLIYFNLGEPALALSWLNKLLNMKTAIRYDLQCFARIFNLVLHYEMGNTEHVENMLLSTEKFLQRHSPVITYEHDMLAFFKKVVRVSNATEARTAFTELEKALNKYKNDQREIKLFLFLDYPSWARAKAAAL